MNEREMFTTTPPRSKITALTLAILFLFFSHLPQQSTNQPTKDPNKHNNILQ